MNKTHWAGVFGKILALVFWLLAVCASVANRAAAQTQDPVKLTAHAGLDGMCKDGAWMPIRVTVENNGGGFDARVQVFYTNNQNGKIISATDISLPATSRKEFFLYTYLGDWLGNLTVSVLEGTTVRASQKLNIRCDPSESYFFGVLADDPAPYNILKQTHPLSEPTPRLAQLTISDLPDRAQGWSALDALVIANTDTGKLTADQKQAMQLWIAKGGKLFITGGIQWQTTTAGLQDLLPVESIVTRKVAGLPTLSAYMRDSATLDGEVTLASGNVRKDATTLVKQDGIPVLVEKQLGYGEVYYFAADPGLQPLSNWNSGMRDVYEHLLAFKPQQPAWANAAWDSVDANRALSSLPELNLPSVLYICCWLGVYVLAIGPVNYLILRWLKRTELAWFTVPLLVMMFACLAYVSGFAYRGFRPVLNRFALGQSWDGVAQARVNDLVGVYSPSRTAYTIETQNQFMLYPPFSADLQGNRDWLLLKTDAGTSLPGVQVEIGGVQSTGAEGSMSALNIRHDLQLIVSEQHPVLEGTITNTSGHTLKGAALITPSEWHSLGDIAPNQTIKIKRPLLNSPGSSSQLIPLSDLGLSPYPASDDRDIIRRSSFFDSNVHNNYGNNPEEVSGIYLMGWVEGIAAPVNLRNQNSNTLDAMLYFHKLTPAIAASAAPFIINSGMYDWQSSNGTLTSSSLSSNGYEVRFQPSQPVRFSAVESFTLQIQSNSPSDKFKVQLWNFETREWDTVIMAYSNTQIPNPAQYVGADGEIRLRLDADQNDYVQIDAIDFWLEVKP